MRDDRPPGSAEVLAQQVAKLAGAEATAVFASLPTPASLAACGVSAAQAEVVLDSTPNVWPSALGLDPGKFAILTKPFDGPDGANGFALLAISNELAATPAVQLGLETLAQAGREHLLVAALERARQISLEHVEQRERDLLALSREVHDGLSQTLTMIRLGLATAKRNIDAGRIEKAQAEIDDLIDLSKLASEAVISLSTGLRPAMIETLGPNPAIRQAAKRLQDSSQIEVACQLEEAPLAPAQSLSIFRIVESVLLISASQPGVNYVAIHLQRVHSNVILQVSVKSVSPVGFPIEVLRERARAARGTLRQEIAPDGDIVITASFPLEALATAGAGGNA